MAELKYRVSILETLKSIADDDPAGYWLTEHICTWFDDLYVPCDDSKSYHQGVLEKAVEKFNALFSEPELAAMTEFHKVFESKVDDINGNGSSKQPAWVEVRNAARKALESFNEK